MNKLRELREKQNYSLSNIEEFVGIKRATLCRYENGNTEPKISSLIVLADFFDVSIDYLVGRSDVR